MKRRLTKSGQKGGILPLATLIPALIAGGKALGLSALGGAASVGAKKRSSKGKAMINSFKRNVDFLTSILREK